MIMMLLVKHDFLSQVNLLFGGLAMTSVAWMLWFNFILGSVLIFLCCILIVILSHTKTKKNKN